MEDVPLPENDDTPRDDPSGASRGLSLRLLSQILTVVIAVAAISLSIWEGVEMRRHNRLSVLPSLEARGIWGDVRVEYLSEQIRDFLPDSVEAVYKDSVALASTGLGPAVLHRVQARIGDSVTYDTERPGHEDKYIFRPVQTTIREVTPGAMVTNVRTYSTGTLFPRGSHRVFNLIIPTSSRPDGVQIIRRKLRGVLPDISVTYCYCSVYGDNCSTTSFWNRDVPDDFECRPFVPVGE